MSGRRAWSSRLTQAGIHFHSLIPQFNSILSSAVQQNLILPSPLSLTSSSSWWISLSSPQSIGAQMASLPQRWHAPLSKTEKSWRCCQQKEKSICLCFSTEVLTRLQDDAQRDRAGSFGRSISDQMRKRPNALTLSTSRSETALSSHLVNAASQRLQLSSGNAPAVEEESSPESAGTAGASIRVVGVVLRVSYLHHVKKL